MPVQTDHISVGLDPNGGPYRRPVHRLELAGYWRLDEHKGDIAFDGAPPFQDGKRVGNVSYVQDGKLNGAASFDGKSAIDLSAKAKAFQKVNRGAISAWVRTKSKSSKTMAIFAASSLEDSGSSAALVLERGTPQFVMTKGASSRMVSLKSFGSKYACNDGKWHHVAVVLDQKTAVLYMDGQPVKYTNSQYGLFASLPDIGSVRIGGDRTKNGDRDFFEGEIDEVRVYKRALTPKGVAAIAAGEEAPNAELVRGPLVLIQDGKLKRGTLDTYMDARGWKENKGALTNLDRQDQMNSRKAIGPGDFDLSAKLAFSLTDISKAQGTFRIGNSNAVHLVGTNEQMYIDRPLSSRKSRIGNMAPLIRKGVPFQFDLRRRGEMIFIFINGQLLNKPIKHNANRLGSIGFWGNKEAGIQVYDLEIDGKLVN